MKEYLMVETDFRQSKKEERNFKEVKEFSIVVKIRVFCSGTMYSRGIAGKFRKEEEVENGSYYSRGSQPLGSNAR